MKLLADENVPMESVRVLQKAGFDVKAVGVEFPSITDEEVLQNALEEDRTLVTLDKDYGELVFKHGFKPKGGVIFLRLRNLTPSGPGEHLKWLFERQEYSFEGLFTVVDETSIRQRRY